MTGPPASGCGRGLSVLSQRYAGTPLGDQINDVLAGRSSMKQLADDPEFATLALEGARQYVDALRQLTPEQRAQLAEQAREMDEVAPDGE